MESGYKIIWTNHALSELKNTLEYLEQNWTEKELKNFSQELDHTLELISQNPQLFPKSENKKEVRKALIAKYNTLFYWRKEKILKFYRYSRTDRTQIKLNFN